MDEMVKITFDRLVRLRFGEKATQRVIAHKLDIAESVYPTFCIRKNMPSRLSEEKVQCKIRDYLGKHEKIPTGFSQPTLRADFAIAKSGFILC